MKYYLILLLIGFVGLISCNNDDKLYEVGEGFIDTDTNVFEVDTLTLETTTIISDSLLTSGASRILIGALQDNDFGNLTAQSYFSLAASTYSIDKDAVFDSISLILHYDRYSYGDTTLVQTYKLHEIIEEFEPNEEDDYFYNTSSLTYSDGLLGQASFTPLPNKKDSINISMNYSFGKNIFDKIIDDEINTVYDLNKEFRGITIVPDKNTNTVLGFKYSSYATTATSTMRLYYVLKDDDSENNEYYIDFNLEGGNKIFNSVTSDRSNTVLSSLTSSEDILPSSETNNKMYLQSGTGISMRVDFPSLLTLNDLENNGTTLSANLKIYPDYESYDDIDLIDSLAVYVIDYKNRGIKQLTSLSGSAIYAKLDSENNEFDANTYYNVDVSSFIEEILTSSYTLDYALRFEFPNNTSTINRLLINNNISPENSNYKMKLHLTYLTY